MSHTNRLCLLQTSSAECCEWLVSLGFEPLISRLQGECSNTELIGLAVWPLRSVRMPLSMPIRTLKDHDNEVKCICDTGWNMLLLLLSAIYDLCVLYVCPLSMPIRTFKDHDNEVKCICDTRWNMLPLVPQHCCSLHYWMDFHSELLYNSEIPWLYGDMHVIWTDTLRFRPLQAKWYVDSAVKTGEKTSKDKKQKQSVLMWKTLCFIENMYSL